MVKIYACSIEINISNPVIIVNNANGAVPKSKDAVPDIITKDAITCIIICPAIMLAASRNDRLRGRAK